MLQQLFSTPQCLSLMHPENQKSAQSENAPSESLSFEFIFQIYRTMKKLISGTIYYSKGLTHDRACCPKRWWNLIQNERMYINNRSEYEFASFTSPLMPNKSKKPPANTHRRKKNQNIHVRRRRHRQLECHETWTDLKRCSSLKIFPQWVQLSSLPSADASMARCGCVLRIIKLLSTVGKWRRHIIEC